MPRPRSPIESPNPGSAAQLRGFSRTLPARIAVWGLIVLGGGLGSARAELLELSNGALITGSIDENEDGLTLTLPAGRIQFAPGDAKRFKGDLGLRKVDDHHKVNVLAGYFFAIPSTWSWLERIEPGVDFAAVDRKTGAEICVLLEFDPDVTLAIGKNNERRIQDELKNEVEPIYTSFKALKTEFLTFHKSDAVRVMAGFSHKASRLDYLAGYLRFKRGTARITLRLRAPAMSGVDLAALMADFERFFRPVEQVLSQWVRVESPRFSFSVAYPDVWPPTVLEQEMTATVRMHPVNESCRMDVEARRIQTTESALSRVQKRLEELQSPLSGVEKFERQSMTPATIAGVTGYTLGYTGVHKGYPVTVLESLFGTDTTQYLIRETRRADAKPEDLKLLDDARRSFRLLRDLADAETSARNREARDTLRSCAKLLQNRKGAEAEAQLSALTQQYPHYMDAWATWADIPDERSEIDKSHDRWKRTYRLYPENPLFRRRYAEVCMKFAAELRKTKKYKEALGLHEEVVRLVNDPSDKLHAEAMRDSVGLVRGLFNEDMRTAKSALSGLSRTFGDHPEVQKVTADYYIKEGSGYEKDEKYSSAMSSYKRALRAYKDYPIAVRAIETLERKMKSK